MAMMTKAQMKKKMDTMKKEDAKEQKKGGKKK